MSHHYSEDEAVEVVARLTVSQLRSFIEAEIVTPTTTETGIVFRQVDIVRMELLCELSEEFDLDPDALGIVISLIDQLHSVRADLRTVLKAVQGEPEDVRERIQAAIHDARSVP